MFIMLLPSEICPKCVCGALGWCVWSNRQITVRVGHGNNATMTFDPQPKDCVILKAVALEKKIMFGSVHPGGSFRESNVLSFFLSFRYQKNIFQTYRSLRTIVALPINKRIKWCDATWCKVELLWLQLIIFQ